MSGKRPEKSSPCPLTSSPTKRNAADQLAATVRDQFPPGLSAPALRALAAAGLTGLDQLARVTETEVAKLHGMGPKGVSTLRAALRKRGKSFKV